MKMCAASWLVYFTVIFPLLAVLHGVVATSQEEEERLMMRRRRWHGFLMWASLGLCMPLGILIVRFMKPLIKNPTSSSNTKTLHLLAYSHFAIQSVAVVLCIVGGSIALANFGSQFSYTHERLGLSLFITSCAMPILGLLRPDRGQPFRPFWYAMHWLVGTSTVILGFINIYIGMHIYELIYSKSLRTYNILFSIQVSIMGLIYLAQDRWSYFRSQGVPLNKPLAPHPPSEL